MKKLSEYRGEEALDVLADLLKPASEIMTDKKLVSMIRAKNLIDAATLAIKAHKKSVLAIMARLEGVAVEEYAPNLLALPKMLLDISNDPEVMSLFSLQGQNMDKTNSGSVTVSTEADNG